jgi:DNA replication protein DnaC
MHSILCARDSKYSKIQENLILVIESKETQQESKKKSLEFLGKDFCRIENFIDELPKKSDFDLIEDGEKAADLDDLQNSKAKAQKFIDRRKDIVANALKEKLMLQIVGHSGVGKSSLLKLLQQENSGYEVYDEMVNFKDWATNQDDKIKILFIDESNIDDWHLTKFSPLKSFNYKQADDFKVKILHDQKFYEIGKNHKVVFARNPNNYSAGRNPQKLFNDGVSTVYFRDFPSSYIYEKILHEPIYQLLDESTKASVGEETFQKVSQKLIAEYKKFNSAKRAKNDEISCKTVRELQEEMMLYLNKKIEVREVSDIETKHFVTTKATKDLEQKLCDAIDIRSKQKAGIFGNLHVGLNGFIIEGEPGVGKSELIGAVLKEKGVIDISDSLSDNLSSQKYYKISASMSIEEKTNAIVEAFEEGNILWIDEINSCIDKDGLEKTLNAALTGKHPSGKADSFRAGFLMISSINPPRLSGRSQLSPAIKHRSNIYQAKSLNDYELDDLIKISRNFFKMNPQYDQAQLRTKTSADNDIPAIFAEAFFEELGKRDKSSINLRDLIGVISGFYPSKYPNSKSDPTALVNIDKLGLKKRV